MFHINKLIEKIHVIYLSISDIFKNEQEKERELQIKLAQIITDSSDPEELKNKIVKEIAITLNACRCFFIEYDSSTNNFKKISNAYNTQRNSLSILGYDMESDIPNFVMKQKYMNSIVIDDAERFLKENKLEGLNEYYYFKNYNIKASITVRLEFGESFLGVLVVHYDEKKPFLQYIDLKFLKHVAEHVSIALYLSTLYAEEKAEKEEERLLRSIISIMNENYDLAHIIQKIFEILGNMYNTQAIFINIDNIKVPDKNASLDTCIYELAIFNEIKNKVHYISDAHNFIIQNNLENTSVEEYFDKNNIKSLILLPILYKNLSLGILIMHFNIPNSITQDDLDFINIVMNQLAIAIKQTLNYENEKKTAEKEALLREITETIRSSLDVDETLSFISSETVKVFNVQRTAITVFTDPKNYEEIDLKKEYKIDPEINGIAESENFSQIASYWRHNTLKVKDALAFDNIEESDTPDYIKNTYKSMGVKSIIGTSIEKGKDVFGTLVLSEYNNYRHWTDEEKTLLKTIAGQVYIAINQAELYERAQTKAQNEKTLREIMLSSVSTFDMKAIINSIVTEAGKLFKADRCFYVEVDIETNSHKPIKDYAEYLSSKDIISHTTRQPSKEETGDIIKRSKPNLTSYINDVSKEDLPEALKKMLEELSVKSQLMTSVFYGDIFYGAIVFHYVRGFKQFSQDEIDMAKAIANQSAIVLHQAELFETTKIQAEREKISKNIIEILRSTLDKSIIKKLFVKNIGNFLKADRVIFSEYNANERKYLPIDKDSEYLSDCNLNSFVDYDWSCEEAQEYIQPLLEKREFHIYNWDEYLQSNTRSQNFINLFERREAKSSYSFPVIYQQQIMGFFSIAFTKQVRRLTDEDINRIRNMCTQAGIALYHSSLYEQAQKSIEAHAEFVNKLSNELKEPLNMIIEFSKIVSKHELECSEEVDHLNTINNNSKKLLYLLDDLVKNAKTKIDFN